MTLQEKITHRKTIFDNYIMKSEFEKSENLTQDRYYCDLVDSTIIDEIRTKYDRVFRKRYIAKNGENLDYLLFDFDAGEFLAITDDGPSPFYETFEGTADSDWVIPEESHEFIFETTIRQKGEKLYYVLENGKLNDSGYVLCDISEPLKYIYE